MLLSILLQQVTPISILSAVNSSINFISIFYKRICDYNRNSEVIVTKLTIKGYSTKKEVKKSGGDPNIRVIEFPAAFTQDSANADEVKRVEMEWTTLKQPLWDVISKKIATFVQLHKAVTGQVSNHEILVKFLSLKVYIRVDLFLEVK